MRQVYSLHLSNDEQNLFNYLEICNSKILRLSRQNFDLNLLSDDLTADASAGWLPLALARYEWRYRPAAVSCLAMEAGGLNPSRTALDFSYIEKAPKDVIWPLFIGLWTCIALRGNYAFK